uniref:photosystem I subunit XI n=1 Tax=Haramonas pauciplastida TaxID=478668 RepID=UPI002113F76A|nr:photosystem I subunit XI [Haramonas pauciplastida]UTE94912.1 photosystem I subunit XI [Haramonas pauciplastida]
MANFIQPYNNDPSVGHLATPITNSSVTQTFLGNLPAYRKGLSPLLRGVEVGMAHGYFLVGPFEAFGPLRNLPVGLLAGFLSTIGLIIILTVCLTIYGVAAFQQASKFNERFSNKDLQTKNGWLQFRSGFLIGAFGGSTLAYILLAIL